jgi:hypothetical protein
LVAYVLAWAAVDLGFQWCDGRFGPFEKPGCRMAWVYLMLCYALIALGVALAIAAASRAWRRRRQAPADSR